MRAWGGVKFVGYKDRAEWLIRRKYLGIGGSEIAGILGLSPYTCAAQVFYEKLGLAQDFRGSLATIIGNEDEPKIAKLWSYYDAKVGKDSIPRNYLSDKIIRKPIKLNKMIVSEKYPYLFSSTDRLFYDEKKRRCLLELKTINPYEAQKWESGVPAHYLLQIQHYMLVLGVEYAELAILEGNMKLDIIPLEVSKVMQGRIIEVGAEFWNKVLEAREIFDKGGTELDIQHLVPGPDGSSSYTNFMKERHTDADTTSTYHIDAEPDDYETLKDLVTLEDTIEGLSREWELRRQLLMKKMAKIPTLKFGEVGVVTWRPDKNGQRSFKKKIKKELL